MILGYHGFYTSVTENLNKSITAPTVSVPLIMASIGHLRQKSNGSTLNSLPSGTPGVSRKLSAALSINPLGSHAEQKSSGAKNVSMGLFADSSFNAADCKFETSCGNHFTILKTFRTYCKGAPKNKYDSSTRTWETPEIQPLQIFNSMFIGTIMNLY